MRLFFASGIENKSLCLRCSLAFPVRPPHTTKGWKTLRISEGSEFVGNSWENLSQQQIYQSDTTLRNSTPHEQPNECDQELKDSLWFQNAPDPQVGVPEKAL